MRIAEYTVPISTVGSAGTASGSAYSDSINGELLAVRLDYSGSAPATTTVTVDEVGGAARRLLTKGASNADVTHTPRVQMQDGNGVNVVGIYERFCLAGRKVLVSVALSDALTPAVTVTLIVLEYK
jgi:hypothetical protein